MRRRFWFGSSAIVLLLWLGYGVLNRFTAARLDRPVCTSTESTAPGTPVTCYQRSQRIFSGATTAIAEIPGSEQIISSTGDQIDRWDLTTGEHLTSWQTNAWVTALAVSPDGNLLASAGMDGAIRLWDLDTGRLLGAMRSGRVSSLAFSPNGRILASASRLLQGTDGTVSVPGVQLWNVQNQEFVDALGKDAVNAIAFSPDGEFLAIGQRSTQIWQLRRRQLVRTLNSGSVTDLEFSSNGRMLITGSSRIRIWETIASGSKGHITGRLLHTLSSGGSDLALSADNQLLAVASGGTVNLWQLRSGLFRGLPNRGSDRKSIEEFGGSSTRDASRRSIGQLTEPSIEQLLGTLRGSHYGNLAIDLDPSTETLITAGSDGIQVWQPQREAIVQATR